MRKTDHHTITLASLGVEIEIRDHSSYGLHRDLETSDLIQNFIPNVSINARQAQNPDFVLNIYHSPQQHLNVSGNAIHFYDNVENGLPSDITFILQKLFDHAYQRQGMLNFHSSAINVNGNGVMFIGAPGCGKTTLALTAEFTKVAKLLSNNRTVIDLNTHASSAPKIIAGTQRISLRAQTLREFRNKYAIPITSRKNTFETPDEVSYDPDHYMSLEDLGLQGSAGDIPLKRVCQIQLCNGFEESITLNQKLSIVRLYENASRAAWGNALIFDGAQLSPIHETQQQAQERLDRVNVVAEHIEMLSLKGTAEFILKKAINRL
jgi:hypothetical protein